MGTCGALEALGSTQMFCHPVYGIIAVKLLGHYV